MEYNPVALNEVLAFSYAYYQGVGSQANRFFVELVNTLTQSAFAARSQSPGGTNPPDPSILDLRGFQYTPGDDPYSGGCWDLVFTEDTPNSRPDPYRGELVQGGQFYALIPLIKDSFTASPAGAAAGSSSKPGSDVKLVPLWAGGGPLAFGGQPGGEPSHPTDELLLRLRQQSSQPGVRDEDTVAHDLLSHMATGSQPTPRRWCSTSAPRPTRSMGRRPRRSPGIPGVLPGVVADSDTSTGSPPPSYQPKLPTLTAGSQKTKYYWVCLRRPANPFARVSADNPMLVVDAMRFPYIDGSATPADGADGPDLTAAVNTVYSAQRFQPYRGGHAVPVAAGTPAGVAAAQPTLDARYGYTEQIAGPTGYSDLLGTKGVYYTGSTSGNPTPYNSTNQVFHTLGIANDQTEPWDYFPFHDRDFTGVAELMLVPGCPPGLFTKQFAEFAPSRTSSGFFNQVVPQSAPPPIITPFDDRRDALRDGLGGQPRAAPHLPLSRGQILLYRRVERGGHGRDVGRQPDRRRLVQDVRVLRGAQPDDGGNRSRRPGDQFRLGPAGHQAGVVEPQPDHR